MKWWVSGLLLLVFVPSVLAVTISLSEIPPQITDQPFTFSVSVSGAKPATNYLRADLFKDGSKTILAKPTMVAVGTLGLKVINTCPL